MLLVFHETELDIFRSLHFAMFGPQHDDQCCEARNQPLQLAQLLLGLGKFAGRGGIGFCFPLGPLIRQLIHFLAQDTRIESNSCSSYLHSRLDPSCRHDTVLGGVSTLISRRVRRLRLYPAGFIVILSHSPSSALKWVFPESWCSRGKIPRWRT